MTLNEWMYCSKALRRAGFTTAGSVCDLLRARPITDDADFVTLCANLDYYMMIK